MRKHIHLLLILAAGATAFAAGWLLRPEPHTALRAEPAAALVTPAAGDTETPGGAEQRPDFELPDVNGQMRRASEWDGKLLIVNFWATWCPPCIHEIPVFIELQEKHAASGVQFLGIAIDERDLVAAFAEKVGMNYPTVHGQLEAIDLMRAYGNGTGGLPFTVLVDRSGRIAFRQAGTVSEEQIEALIAAHR